jgi:hypothetical protein
MRGENNMNDIASMVQKGKIFECLGGSYSYGLNTPESDKDIRGIFIAPPEQTFGLSRCEQYKPSDEEDTNYISLTEITKQWYNGAVNWLELLFLEDKSVLSVNMHYMADFYSLKNEFINQVTLRKSMGFIDGMIKRCLHNIEKNNDPATIRKEAMHGVRMSHTMVDLIKDGEWYVDRSDERDYLLKIKTGLVDIETAVQDAELNLQIIKSNLDKYPVACNKERVEKVLIRTCFEYWKNNGKLW